MSVKRAAIEDAADKRPITRRRRFREKVLNHNPVSLDYINNDCMFLIFQHLPTDGLNSIADCLRPTIPGHSKPRIIRSDSYRNNRVCREYYFWVYSKCFCKARVDWSILLKPNSYEGCLSRENDSHWWKIPVISKLPSSCWHESRHVVQSKWWKSCYLQYQQHSSVYSVVAKPWSNRFELHEASYYRLFTRFFSLYMLRVLKLNGLRRGLVFFLMALVEVYHG
jgi:hypothetical protein